MRSLENKYYERINLPEPPYEQMPEFPPKPFTSKRKNSNHKNRDFIEKVNEANLKRQAAFSGHN
jgi:hypothetical protein